VKINKEIQRYQESILFGLSLRQMVFALLAIGVAVGAYFGLKPLIGAAEVGWVCMLAAFCFPAAALPADCSQVIVGSADGWNSSHVQLSLLEKGPRGWVGCFPRCTLVGTVFAGGVNGVGEIAGHIALEQAYQMGEEV